MEILFSHLPLALIFEQIWVNIVAFLGLLACVTTSLYLFCWYVNKDNRDREDDKDR